MTNPQPQTRGAEGSAAASIEIEHYRELARLADDLTSYITGVLDAGTSNSTTALIRTRLKAHLTAVSELRQQLGGAR